jgi:hypothetical protein
MLKYLAVAPTAPVLLDAVYKDADGEYADVKELDAAKPR